MGLFKKGKTGEKKDSKKELPQLPELPKLPELEIRDNSGLYSQSVNQLPRFPNNSTGDKFSQNTIKEAVAGGKEGEESFEADDFANSMQMMQKTPRGQFAQEIPNLPKREIESLERIRTPTTKIRSKEISEMPEIKSKVKKAEPVFIRLDKFEESLNLFDKTKKQISEVESMLTKIKKLKEEEEEELEFWEKELQSIKIQIEKVDRDIFSKVE